ncbi:MAG TPA: MFS transporter, partial [Chloroflexota bacterium]
MGAELHWSRSAFFFAVSLRGWIGIILTPLVGPYLDRPNGPRILALIGGVINTVSLLLIPWAVSDWQFTLLFGVLGGVAQAAQGGLTPATVPKWFVRQRGSAVAISTLGGSVTAVILPPLIAVVSDAAGWRAAWLALAAGAFLLGTLPTPLLHREPEDLGMLPDGGPRREPEQRSVPTPRADEPAFTRDEALHTSAFWMLLIVIAIGSLANNGIPATLAPIFVDRGYAFEIGAASLAWYGVGSIVTKIVWGW